MRKGCVLFSIIGILMFLTACESEQKEGVKAFDSYRGETMGTVYNITVPTMGAKNLKAATDSILQAYNNEVSTYIDSSVISRFNQTRDTFRLAKSGAPHFFRNLVVAYRFHYLTDGYFDPTVMPLVNYWGFGYAPRDTSGLGDTAQVEALMQFVGLNRLGWEERGDSLWLIKPAPELQLDFSASAKGDGVDVLARYLSDQGFEDFMIEIGGEVYARGENPMGRPWTIGVHRPDPEGSMTDFIEKVKLSGKGLATSGNYRNFFEAGGVTYSHTIQPKTGWVERNDLLSVTVIADEVLTADVWATALMTMGREAAKQALEEQSEITGFLVFRSGNEMEVHYDKEFKQYRK